MKQEKILDLIRADNWTELKPWVPIGMAIDKPSIKIEGWPMTLLQAAAQEGALKVIEGLLGRGAGVDSAKKYRTALAWAVSADRFEAAQTLLKHGANPNLRCGALVDEGGKWTPLLCAVYRGNTEMVKLLLEHGADPSFVSTTGIGCITCAADRQNYELAELLLEAAAPAPGHALFCGIERRNERVFKLLLKAGCNPNVRAGKTELSNVEEGDTPLMYAIDSLNGVRSIASLGYVDEQRRLEKETTILVNMIAGLLRAGADPNMVCDTRTPLSCAISTRELEVVKLLIAHGAEPIGKCFSPYVEFKDKSGDEYGFYETALHTAVKCGTYAIIAVLLKAGADPLWKDHAGVTVLEVIQDTFDKDMRALFEPWLTKT